MTERDTNGTSLPDAGLDFKAKNFKPEVEGEVKENQGYSDNSFDKKVSDGLLIENLIGEIKAETGPIDVGEKIISEEIPNEAVSVEEQNVGDSLENQIQKKDKINILGKIQRGLRDIREDYLPNTPKKVATLVAAALTSFQLGISSVKAETPAPADPNATHPAESGETNTEDDFPTDINGATLAPGNPAENGNVEYPTEEYAAREKKLAECREEMKEQSCQENYLDKCAEWLCSRRTSAGFGGFGKGFDLSKTVLSSYLSDEQIYEFGKNGKFKPTKGVELGVVWYKDEKGKKTDNPGILYVGASDWNVGLKQVQKAIDELEKTSPGFLKSMNENGVCVIMQGKADKEAGVYANYGDGILYINCGLLDKKKSYVKQLKKFFTIEQFGNKMQLLGGKYFGDSGEMAGVLKQLWAVKCGTYLCLTTKDSFFDDMLEGYKIAAKRYLGYLEDSSSVASIMEEAEKDGLVSPFVGVTWEEINNKVGNVFDLLG
jgi:hypothetical protein